MTKLAGAATPTSFLRTRSTPPVKEKSHVVSNAKYHNFSKESTLHKAHFADSEIALGRRGLPESIVDEVQRMSTPFSPRANGRGKPEGEPCLDGPVQVRSLDARRRMGEVSQSQASELVRRSLCIAKRSASGKLQYLRLLIPEEELPVRSSIASLITVRHVQGQRSPGLRRGDDYYEHRYPDSVAITDRTRRQA